MKRTVEDLSSSRNSMSGTGDVWTLTRHYRYTVSYKEVMKMPGMRWR